MASRYYPKWVHCADGADRIVNDHLQHTALTGIEHGEDGKPVPQGPKPPTLEEVLAAGYGEEAAKAIVEPEAAKAAAGIKPYGDKEPSQENIAPSLTQPPAKSEIDDPLGMFTNKE